MGETRNAYTFLDGKPAREKPVGRPRNRWQNNIRMNLREVGCEVVDWIHLSQDKDQ
jgi:hypothetical protein